jgi:hypothetical protein
MTEKDEFQAAFSSLKINDIIQCADVKNTTNRKWVRLVGLGYDLQLWSPDMRRPTPPVKTTYDQCATQWIKGIHFCFVIVYGSFISYYY